MKRLFILALTLALISAADAAVYYVDAVSGDSANDGLTPQAAFATIQRAIDAANDGDTVTVAQGTYTEDINFLGKNLTLSGTAPTNSAIVRRTTIDGSVTFRGTEEASCTLIGFNITDSIIGVDRGIDPAGENHTHATISHCVLENIATHCGGVIQACDGTISHCLIANISYSCRRAWPVAAIVGCHGLIENCTMVNMRDGIEIAPGQTCTIANCIFYASPPFSVPAEATFNISYSNTEKRPEIVFGDGTVNWGPGNMSSDPCFADPNGGDYHLKSQAGRYDADSETWAIDETTSLCIDTGDPMTPINFEPFPNGGIVNMGVYGGTPEASKSYFGKPPCPHIIAGDVNGDCVTDFKDAAITFLHWLEDSSP